MSLAFVPVYVKYLGIDGYGLIGLFAAVQAWLVLADAGMSPTLGREMARFRAGAHSAESIRNLLRTVEIILGALALLAAGVIWASAGWLATDWLRADRLSVETVREAFTIMGVVTGLRMLEGSYRSCLFGLQRQVLFNSVNAVLNTIRAVGAVSVLAFLSPSIHAFFVWQAIASVASLLTLRGATYRSLPRSGGCSRFSLDALSGVWRFAGGMLATTALALLLTQVDKVLLSKLLTLTQYGHYTLAVAAAGALYMVITPITQAWYPRLCELQSEHDRQKVAEVYHQGAQLITVLAGSATIVLALFANAFLCLWTQNPRIAAAVAPVLTLMIIGNLLNGFMWMPYQMQLASGWTSLAIVTNSIAVLLVIPAIFWATPRYGAEGAAAVWVLLNMGYVLVGAYFMHRRILPGERVSWLSRDLAQPLVFALAAAAGVKLMSPAPQGAVAQFGTIAAATVVTLAGAAMGSSYGRKAASHLLAPLFARIRHST